MMINFFIVVPILLLAAHTNAAVECRDGWTAYKDEFCLKTLDRSVSYEEARNICAAKCNEISNWSLATANDAGMQNLLDLKPKRYMVICRKRLSLSLEDAVGEIINLRRRVETSEQNLEKMQKELRMTQENLERVSTRVVPVGSIYIEYFGQPCPTELWPDLSWEDISSTYAGLFFRVTGGGSAAFGTFQPECVPRISQMEYTRRRSNESEFPYQINIPSSGWSDVCHAGELQNSVGRGYYEGLRFYAEDCEVRPSNQAVRIWKRTA